MRLKMSKKKKKKIKKIKERNWVAVAAHFKPRAGSHENKKKKLNKYKCRKKVKEEQ